MRKILEEERADYFWAKVDRARSRDCWPWTGGHTPKGYGRFSLSRGRAMLAHRMAWELSVCPVPDGLLVMHLCDNPPCCNPAHLVLGTSAANNYDTDRKGRMPRGEQTTAARLTDAAVLDARQRWRAGQASIGGLARENGITTQAMRNAIEGQTWGHVQEA